MAQPITFVIPGRSRMGATRGAAPVVQADDEVKGRVKQSVKVSPASRAGGEEVTVEAEPFQDVVVLTIEGGPRLTLNPEHARELFMAQGTTSRSGNNDHGPNVVRVPAQLQWRGLEPSAQVRGVTRGFLGDVVLSAVDVIKGVFNVEEPVTGNVKDVAKKLAAQFVATGVVKHVDGQVTPGVYSLADGSLPVLKGSNRLLTALPPVSDGGAHLVLIHGTFSNTSAAFGKLWSDHPDRVRTLFKHYGDRVFALEHKTLGVSPIENALDLANAAPVNGRLHLLTHSRGGLVAEVLARACALPNTDLTFFDGSDYSLQREQLKQLSVVVSQKNLRVDRIVRVACPARGTLLASNRLDAYVSVFKWTLTLAGVPIIPELVDFLGAVAQFRADPTESGMPGLAAQIPDSPLIRWLHDGDARIPGDLRVIAGDVQGDSIKSWLKTLLADSFYWTDNDLVVQTRSMYGGSPRTSAQFLLHQAGDVSHGLYFKNEKTAEATVAGLTQDSPADFRQIGPLSWAGESSTGVRASRRSATAGSTDASKPAVFLLPGILGSNLTQADDRIWLAWRVVNGLDRLKYVHGVEDKVKADGPIGLYYDSLAEFLSATHEVVEFGFDWRRPIEAEARRLGEVLARSLEARAKTGTPVRIIAHSMGGIVARTLQLEAPDVWTRMMGHAGARLLMLGTPNGGSYAPMQVLSGDDTLGNLVSAVGAPFRDDKSRQLIADFPGLLQLQADLLDGSKKLDTEVGWKKIADEDAASARAASWWHKLGIQLRSLEWGVPSQLTLTTALNLRRRLDEQRDQVLPEFKDKLLLVVGEAPLTPVGFEQAAGSVIYLNVPETGDGRVSRESAQLPGVRTWRVKASHGGLPSEKSAFQGYLELLEHGSTKLLDAVAATAATTRSAGETATAPFVRTRPSRVPQDAVPAQSESDVVTGGGRRADGERESRKPLRVTVTNGDLSFIREPLFLGHYRSSKLTGTEKVMNRLTGGAMASALDVGLYPDPPGSHQVFINTRQPNPLQSPRPESVIVVGLGQEGNLRGSQLVTTVRLGIMAWVQRIAERPKRSATLDIAATLIGSGGSGIGAGQSAQLIAEGVRQANDLIEQSRNGWPLIGHLYLIELYLDRASEACRALLMQAEANPERYAVTDVVHQGQGALRRTIDSGYRGADYDFITAISTKGVDDEPQIGYTIDTKRARTEIRSQAAQGRLLRSLIAAASNDTSRDDQLRSALFQLLVPIELEPFLDGSTEMQIELDGETAGIPWELLDPGPKDGEQRDPWAIRSKLVRKLRTETFREQVADAGTEARVLVIGEPECDLNVYPSLPAARDEARAVVERLTRPGALPAAQVTSLIAPDRGVGANSQTVIKTLMSDRWRIVHIAGHGEPPKFSGDDTNDCDPPKEGAPPRKLLDPQGVVLSDCTFLGPREIRNMRIVPELVFVNCCHLAVKPGAQLLAGARGSYDRARFASGVAEELIRLGVRCVVAAGWAVEDGPAKTFATTFYDALLRGQRFIDAVGEARVAAYREGGNTWGAYQCYGDPDWTLRSSAVDPQTPTRSLVDEFTAVMSPLGLTVALETIAVRSTFQNANAAEQQTRLQYLQDRFPQWADHGDVAEGYGMAWLATGNTDKAIEWLTRATEANDGRASLKAVEQLANVRTRNLVAKVAGASDGSARRARIEEARKGIQVDIELLKHLTSVQSTSERESLLGSAYKRLALLERLVPPEQLPRRSKDPESDLNRLAFDHYRQAEQHAEAAKLTNVFYPAMNRLGVELVMSFKNSDWTGLDQAALTRIQNQLQDVVVSDPDFWNVAARTEIQMYRAVDARQLDQELGRIVEEFSDLQARISDPWKWRSVYDQSDYVLSAYGQHVEGAERAAVDKLLAKLAAWAQVPRPKTEPETQDGTSKPVTRKRTGGKKKKRES